MQVFGAEIDERVRRCVGPDAALGDAAAVEVENRARSRGQRVERLNTHVEAEIAVLDLTYGLLIVKRDAAAHAIERVTDARARAKVILPFRRWQRSREQRVLRGAELVIAEPLVPAWQHGETAVPLGEQAAHLAAGHHAVEAGVACGAARDLLASEPRPSGPGVEPDARRLHVAVERPLE